MSSVCGSILGTKVMRDKLLCTYGNHEKDFKMLPVNCSLKYLELNIVSPDAIPSLSLVMISGCLARRHSINTSAVSNASSAGDSLGLRKKTRRRIEEEQQREEKDEAKIEKQTRKNFKKDNKKGKRVTARAIMTSVIMIIK